MIEAAKLQVEIVADSDSAQRDIEGFGKKLDNMSRDLTRTGGVLSAAVAAPLIGIGTAAVNSAASFEQSMNILQQVSGASESAMASMSEQALQLGADTVFSANEAASAMVELAKAGMDTEDVMASIGGVMDLAAAGGVALAEAASITAATLQAFSLEANEANRIADLFAATANASAADITDLSQGMRQAGFAFNLANQPVENLAASLAVLTNVGLTGSDAGTALKNAFMRMMNPTEEAKDVINDLGLSFYDASGNMKQLPDIIDMLNIATAGLTNQQRDAALATIFMSDGMKAMIPLMNLGKEGFNAMLTEVTKTGAATEVADARMKGLRGGIEELRGSIDTALITAAMPFLDMLGEMARGAADLITEFSGLPQPVIDSSLAFLATLASAGLLMLALGGLTAAITALNPVLLLAAVGAALFAAAWAGNWGDIQGKAEEAINAITPLIDNLITKIGELGTAVSTAFSNTTFPTLDELVRDFKAGDFQKLATTIRTTAVDLLVNLDTELNITGKATQLRGQLLGIINGVGAAISGLDLGGATTQLSGLRDKIETRIETLLDGVNWTTLSLDTDALVARVGTLLSTIPWSTLSVNFGTLISTLSDKITAQADALLGPGNVVSRTVDRLGGLMSTLQTTLGNVDATQPLDVLEGAISSIASILGTMGAIKGDALQTGIDALHKTLTSVLDFGTLLTSAIDATLLADAASGIVTGLADQIKAAFAPEKMQSLGISFGGLVATIGSKLSEALATPEFGEKIGTAVGSATGAFVTGAAALVKGIMDQISIQDVSKFQAQVDQFVLGFISGTASSLVQQDWSAVGGAIRDGIILGIKTAFADRNIFSFLPGPLGNVLGSAGKAAGAPTVGDTFGQIQNLKLPELKRPEWLNEIINWQPTVPTWVAGLLLWSNTVPAWVTALTSLNLDFDFSDLTNWEFSVPDELLSWTFPSPTELIEWKFPSPTQLLDWQFPSPSQLLDWDWPSMSMPGWVSSLISALGGARASAGGGGGGGGTGGFNATGTPYWQGGLSWVGERGPELVDLPRGSRIHSNRESMAMAGGATTINVYVDHINSDMDLESLANKLARKFQQRIR